ncbi:hypothetical protein PS3A_15690 [Pseudomonas sp. 3A(2025)]
MAKAASSSRSTADYWLLHIELLDTEPSIWRRVAVPSDLYLDDLHEVLQGVMGWEDEHLHAFRIGNVVYGMDDDAFESDGEPESQHTLGDAVGRKKTFTYLYDFGDDWQHKVTVEKRGLPASDFPQRIYCVEGANACPLEDIGGVPGYYFMLEALADPEHPEHESVAGIFKGFDPSLFDLQDTNEWLKQFNPLDAREVYQVLKDLALEQRSLRKADVQPVDQTADASVVVEVDDWLLILASDEQGLALCQLCRAPDGRLGTIDDWHRAGTDPVAFLSAWEKQQVERLLKGL